MTHVTNRPATRPRVPNFSSGPCTKRPGWSLEALADAPLGRSHRAAAHLAATGLDSVVIDTRDPSASITIAGRRRPATHGSYFYQTEDGEWRDVSSSEINAYLKEISGADISANRCGCASATAARKARRRAST